MSLINQMLQDLEQRNAPGGKTEPVSGEVRVAPARTTSNPTLLVGGVLALLLASAAAWFYLKPAPAVSVSMPSVQDRPVPAMRPVDAPAPQAQAPVPEMVSVVPAPAPAVESVRRIPGLDTTLESVPPSKHRLANRAAADLAAATWQSPDAQATPVAAGGAETAPAKGAPIKSVSASQLSENLYRQSLTLLQQGRVAEAQDALRKSLDANPSNLKARQALVGLLVEGKHHDEAMLLLQDGLRLAPEQSGFSMALARLQIEAGDAKGGSDTLERGLPYAGEDAEYHAFYAAMMQREERHDVAVAHYLTALKSNPAMPSWLVGIGISWQAQGQFADANEAFQRAKDTGQLTPQLLRFVDQRLQQIKSAR